MEKLPIAPARRVASAAESLSDPGGTMDGMLTRSGSLQPACGTSSATVRSASSLAVCFMVFSSGSEGHVDAADEVPHRRLTQEVRHVEVELTGLAELGVHTPVLGPGGQVTPRQRETQGLGPDAGRPSVGSRVRQRHLTQLHETSIFEEPRLEPVEKRCTRRRLVRERRAGQVQPMADREQTAELLGAVVELVAPAAVQQGVQLEVTQQTDLGGERRAAGGDRRSLESVGITWRDIGERIDQAVAVQVPEAVGRAPVPTSRVALLVPLRG